MKYKFQVMVALIYDDKDIEVEVELSDEEVAKIKELVAKDCETRSKKKVDEDSYQSPQDLLQILEDNAPKLFSKFWDVIMPPVFVEMLIDGMNNGYMEQSDDEEFGDYHKADFDELYAMYGEEIELEHSSCCICKVPEAFFAC